MQEIREPICKRDDTISVDLPSGIPTLLPLDEA